MTGPRVITLRPSTTRVWACPVSEGGCPASVTLLPDSETQDTAAAARGTRLHEAMAARLSLDRRAAKGPVLTTDERAVVQNPLTLGADLPRRRVGHEGAVSVLKDGPGRVCGRDASGSASLRGPRTDGKITLMADCGPAPRQISIATQPHTGVEHPARGGRRVRREAAGVGQDTGWDTGQGSARRSPCPAHLARNARQEPQRDHETGERRQRKKWMRSPPHPYLTRRNSLGMAGNA